LFYKKFPFSTHLFNIFISCLAFRSKNRKGLIFIERAILTQLSLFCKMWSKPITMTVESGTYLGAGLVKKGQDKKAFKAFQKAASFLPTVPSEELKIISKPYSLRSRLSQGPPGSSEYQTGR
jgi:hypothetical protein